MRRRDGVALLAAMATLAAGMVMTACSSRPATAPVVDNRPRGGIATLATILGAGPDWIFPFGSLPYYSTTNYQDFIDLMYRPLYLFGGNDDSVTANYPLSPARAPVYRDGGRTISITLKGWRWSDGEKVDAADVVFSINMDQAEKANFAGYVKGGIPDDVVSYHAVGPDTVVLQLTRRYAATWFTYNELAQITPMPMAWDISSAGAAPGSGGCTRDSAADHWARCRAVYGYLIRQSKDRSTYAAPSAVWRVVDGPWRLSSFSITGRVTFLPNRRYSGSPKPAISELRFVPYSNDQAILKALKAGQVDLAAIPQQYLPSKPLGSVLPATNPVGKNDYLQAAYNFGINYYAIDFQYRRDSALFSQLYFRQALQELTDQAAIARIAYGGYAVPTTAGVPDEPRSLWVSSDMSANKGAGLYPYDPARAESLLAAHGWSVVNGTLTCARPGALASECGAGISKGLKANLGFAGQWTSYAFPHQSPMGIVRAGLAAAGIHLSGAFIGTALPFGPLPCLSNCMIAMQSVGGWQFNGPGYAPTGEPLFQTGGNWNLGAYSSPEMDSLINAVQASDSIAAFHAYANYTATQLPVIWLPNTYSVVAVSSGLRGVTQNPLGSFYPEYWYFAKPKRH